MAKHHNTQKLLARAGNQSTKIARAAVTKGGLAANRRAHDDEQSMTMLMEAEGRVDDAADIHVSSIAPARPVIWFEVEDFLRYFDHFPNPIGMYRVALEILASLWQRHPATDRIRLCRLSLYSKKLETIAFETLLAAYSNPPGADAPWHAIPLPMDRWRKPAKIAGALARMPRYVVRVLTPVFRDLWRARLGNSSRDRSMSRGDIVVSLGGPWINPRYSECIGELKESHGVKFVQLIHDTIPIDYPERMPYFGEAYRRWFRQITSTTDLVVTVSQFSRSRLLSLAASQGVVLPPVEVIRLGAGFTQDQRRPARHSSVARLPERYVLCVSTFEVRKNHRFLIRVWQRILERRGADAVPTLVLVGRPGYLMFDFLKIRSELEATSCLDGKIVVLPNLPDGGLREVFQRCLFTVYPSLCEGWGLPVAESLVQGKFCLASNRTSLPEVGGDFVDYFDPTNEEDALAKIERALIDPAYLAAREARLRAEFQPSSWDDCANALVDKVEQLARPATARRAPQGGHTASSH